MQENNIFQENGAIIQEEGKRPSHTPSLVLGILSIVFSILLAIVGDILGIIGIAVAVSNRNKFNTKPGLICSIIGLVLSIVSHIVSALLIGQILSSF